MSNHIPKKFYEIDDSLKPYLQDETWTLNNLYRIIDKRQYSIPFRLNWAQKIMLQERERRNIVLKARQIGSSTFWCLFFLNRALFRPNQNIGIISYNLQSAGHILKKIIGHALKTLPEPIKYLPQCLVTSQSAREVTFANGSSIRVDTSMRSGTLSGLLVTEFGKICARYPAKADEILTGSINAVPQDSIAVIESTAEGSSGHFYDMYKGSELISQRTPYDWKPFFFPWHEHSEYTMSLDMVDKLSFPKRLSDYYDQLYTKHSITLTTGQKYWYAKQYGVLGESCRQEYPSTPDESFSGSTEAYYYLREIAEIMEAGQVCSVPYQDSSLVYVAMDIGYNDATSVWFFQLIPGGSIHIIDYYSNSGEGPVHYIADLKSRRYKYGCIYLPHDANSHGAGANQSTAEQFRAAGLPVTVLERMEGGISAFQKEIQHVRHTLKKCWFDEGKCKEGLKGLKSYRKKWNAQIEEYQTEPVHDFASHPADAFRYLSNAIADIQVSSGTSMEHELAKIRKYQRSRV